MAEVFLRAGEALSAMEAGEWESALQIWMQMDLNDSSPKPEYLHAFARTCEVLEQWSMHRDLLQRALQCYPADSLSLRLQVNNAIALYNQQCWAEAFDHLTRLVRAKGMEYWPFTVEFYRWQALLRMKLEGVESVAEKLELLDRWGTSKSEGVRSAQAAGLDIAVELMAWDPELKKSFRAVYRPVLDYLKRVRGLLWHISDPVLKEKVQSLAEFYRRNPKCLEELPISMVGFFASFFLIFGCAEEYLRLRHCFVRGLSRPDVQARPEKRLVEVMYQMLLANEQADEAGFLSVKNMVYQKYLGDGRDQLLRFIKFSELYHKNRQAVDFSFLDWNADDEAFAAYLRGKSVAIVGPVDVGLDNGEEIDGFDVVIRLNHKAHHERDVRKFGARTDVAYYVYNDLEFGGWEGCLAALPELKFAVIDDLTKANFEFPELDQCRIRMAMNVGKYGTNPFLFGYANAIQRLLMDLARFPVGCIKVFNANLYLTKGYAGNYCEGPLPEYMRAFSLHDPVSNFIFMQRLFQLRSIEADSVLSEVLNLDADIYAEMLFQVHVE